MGNDNNDDSIVTVRAILRRSSGTARAPKEATLAPSSVRSFTLSFLSLALHEVGSPW